MKTSITKKFTFEASHQLPHHLGKCHALHGHSYHLEVTVSAPVEPVIPGRASPSEGMVMDFSDLSYIVKTNIIEVYDHTHLNNFFEVPTAEILATSFFKNIDEALCRINEKMGTSLLLEKVRLSETDSSYTEVTYE
jgi:6-pyruvoyltetrahydropterin/6-carboxytetrahydropterin synthase